MSRLTDPDTVKAEDRYLPVSKGHFIGVPGKLQFGWKFSFQKKSYRVYVYDDLLSVSAYNGEMMMRMFVIKLGKSKRGIPVQAVMRDIIYLFGNIGMPKPEWKKRINQTLSAHIKEFKSQ